MGMLGIYNAHYYCDRCNKFQEIGDQVYSAREANKAIRSLGWILSRKGDVLCDDCAKKPKATLILMPDDNREGSDWRSYS